MESIKGRFESFIEKNNDTGCWTWTGSKNYGYGQIRIEYKTFHAHRVAWMLYKGDIPKDLIVRHKCRGKCVNPEHLELGTRKDNRNDMVRDGTTLQGEKCIRAKLTDEVVRKFKLNIPATGKVEYYKTSAVLLNVSWRTLSNIAQGITWKHI